MFKSKSTEELISNNVDIYAKAYLLNNINYSLKDFLYKKNFEISKDDKIFILI